MPGCSQMADPGSWVECMLYSAAWSCHVCKGRQPPSSSCAQLECPAQSLLCVRGGQDEAHVKRRMAAVQAIMELIRIDLAGEQAAKMSFFGRMLQVWAQMGVLGQRGGLTQTQQGETCLHPEPGVCRASAQKRPSRARCLQSFDP